MDQIDLVFRGLDALGRLLLKGVHDPDVVADLHGVDHPERIASVLEHDLHHAAVKALEWFGAVGLAALGGHRQGP